MRLRQQFISVAAVFLMIVGAVHATPLTLTFIDPQGDGGPVGDAVFAQLTFDQSGAWTAHWKASAAKPFTGNARFNLNLFDTALGDLALAHAPQVSLVGFYDFGTSEATEFSYSGITPFLAGWHPGDVVSTGNISYFESGVVAQFSPYGRDKLLTSATVIQAIPEPKTGLLLLLGGSLLALFQSLKRTGRTSLSHSAQDGVG